LPIGFFVDAVSGRVVPKTEGHVAQDLRELLFDVQSASGRIVDDDRYAAPVGERLAGDHVAGYGHAPGSVTLAQEACGREHSFPDVRLALGVSGARFFLGDELETRLGADGVPVVEEIRVASLG